MSKEVSAINRVEPLLVRRPIVPMREVIDQLRTGSKEERKLIGILQNENEFLKIKTTELNRLLSCVYLPHGHWEAIKWEKRKIRKKINKRNSDGKKKKSHFKCEREVALFTAERDRLREERNILQREVCFYALKIQQFNW